jgi:hypothetical protein
MIFKYFKFFLFLLITFILYYIWVRYIDSIWHELIHVIVFPIVFLLVNYAFIKLILWYIKFYNDLLIIHDWQLIVIKSSLFFKDNIEFIDINKITKLDTYCTWFIANFFSFWTLVAEQQRDEVRKFHSVPNPFIALQLLNEEKQKLLQNMKNNK